MQSELVTIEGPGPLNPIPGRIDWSRPVRTVNLGTPVHIYAIDHNLARPVVGRRAGEDDVDTWYYDGSFRMDRTRSGLDLENVP